jgi:DNA polymerase III alpha subunit (gram-positive type)
VSDRQRVVVDVETTGLDPAEHVVVEVAWWCLETGEKDRFVPPHGDFEMRDAMVQALTVNGYYDRGLDNPSGWDRDGTALHRLHEVLQGQTLVGANPLFDIAFLGPLFAGAGLAVQPWHYRVLDVEAYARGVLGLDYMPSLSRVCELLAVEPGDHTAAGDVAATGWALLELESRRMELRPPLPPTAVVLDAASEADHVRLTRAALRIPPNQTVSSHDRAFGRRALQVLAKGAGA